MLKQKDLIETILKMLPREPRSYDTADDPGFWTDGNMILCPSESECEIVVEFLKDVLSGWEGTVEIVTGYFDPYEDVRNGETDNYTGFYYIDFQ